MRYRESKEERQKKIERAKELLKETPPEKNDLLAMIIAAFIVFLPVLIMVLAVFILIIGFLFLW
ncbi:MAG: hypothetical protein WC251_00715 [Candidatus Izemoplasmatales bacterium]|jgi:hypothetical protein|nr:hypothetical protein [Candidatus Izemoplasmatales bacterium]